MKTYIIFERWSESSKEYNPASKGWVAIDHIQNSLCDFECDALHFSLLNWADKCGLSYDPSYGNWMNDSTGLVAVYDGNGSGELNGDCDLYAISLEDVKSYGDGAIEALHIYQCKVDL